MIDADHIHYGRWGDTVKLFPPMVDEDEWLTSGCYTFPMVFPQVSRSRVWLSLFQGRIISSILFRSMFFEHAAQNFDN
jgi:hypothetical protein